MGGGFGRRNEYPVADFIRISMGGRAKGEGGSECGNNETFHFEKSKIIKISLIPDNNTPI